MGEPVSGTYSAVLERLQKISFAPQAAIILFSCGTGVEEFLDQWRELFPAIPAVGGAAARTAGQERGELLPPAEDVTVLLLADGPWKVETLNVHDAVHSTWEFQAAGPRTISRLRRPGTNEWETAASLFRKFQMQFNRANDDCESVTFSDSNGRNVHCSFAGESLQTGADLPTQGPLLLRTVNRAAVAERLKEFCAVPNALVFGCAGLRSLLDGPFTIAPGSLVGFMFGELMPIAGRPQFCNLMAVRLVRQ
jgi:hypothetical protein